LISFFAWLLQWMRFYPGNPVQNAVALCGFALSAASLVMAGFAHGLKRLMGITIAFTTTLLWIIEGIASVAV
jgi:hypothetical protein